MGRIWDCLTSRMALTSLSQTSTLMTSRFRYCLSPLKIVRQSAPRFSPRNTSKKSLRSSATYSPEMASKRGL